MKKLSVFIALLLICGCGLSKGLERKKLEYSYKFKNQASLLNEFTHEIPDYKMLELYRDRVQKMQGDIGALPLFKEWDRAQVIREEFLKLLETNRIITDSILLVYTVANPLKVHEDPSITDMQKNTGKYLEFIDKEIALVEKE